jgi:hypothetical protein
VKAAVEAFHSKLPYRDGMWVNEIQENMRKGIGGWSGKGLLPLDRPMYTEKTGMLFILYDYILISIRNARIGYFPLCMSSWVGVGRRLDSSYCGWQH